MPLCLWKYQGLLSLLQFTGLSFSFQICPSLHAFAWAPTDIPLCVPIRVSQNTAPLKDILCFEIFSSQYAYICTSKQASVYVYISSLELLLHIYLDQGFAKIWAYNWVSKDFPLCAYIRVSKDAPLHMQLFGFPRGTPFYMLVCTIVNAYIRESKLASLYRIISGFTNMPLSTCLHLGVKRHRSVYVSIWVSNIYVHTRVSKELPSICLCLGQKCVYIRVS